jgi:DNA replication licensing factor MCM6
MKKSELVNWYLEQIVDQIESEDELAEKKALVDKVIDRLMYHVCIDRFIVFYKIE